ncbi:hypothetical protein AB0K43_00470 [Kitasatospora sp. NPDC049258]|uniref:hypothetical protein n=1 Tax=Kitasatospora sp. NPDC049258 TaxID=3155394 RepID=UPI00343FB17B
MLADGYRLAAYVANQFGARDLAYAAIGHAQAQAERGGGATRTAMVASGRSWICMRDSLLDQAAEAAGLSYEAIEPRYGDRDPARRITRAGPTFGSDTPRAFTRRDKGATVQAC